VDAVLNAKDSMDATKEELANAMTLVSVIPSTSAQPANVINALGVLVERSALELEPVTAMEPACATEDSGMLIVDVKHVKVNLDLAPTTDLATVMETVLATLDGLIPPLCDKSVIAQLNALLIDPTTVFADVVFAIAIQNISCFLIAHAKSVLSLA